MLLRATPPPQSPAAPAGAENSVAFPPAAPPDFAAPPSSLDAPPPLSAPPATPDVMPSAVNPPIFAITLDSDAIPRTPLTPFNADDPRFFAAPTTAVTPPVMPLTRPITNSFPPLSAEAPRSMTSATTNPIA